MEAEDELVERQRKIRQLKATGIQEKHLLEWNFAVAEDNKDIQMAKRYVEQWKKVKAPVWLIRKCSSL